MFLTLGEQPTKHKHPQYDSLFGDFAGDATVCTVHCGGGTEILNRLHWSLHFATDRLLVRIGAY